MKADNKTKTLQTDSNADLIFKKGDYVHTYIVIETSGLPNGATLYLLDENLNQLYSPYDVNANQVKTPCTIIVGETDALQLPANYIDDEYTDFSAGTYHWNLKYHDVTGKTFEDKIIPVTIKIQDFNVEVNLTPSMYPNGNIRIQVKTYLNTIPSSDNLNPDKLTTNATYDDTTGIITYPNSDIIDLTVGEHIQYNNNVKLFTYTIENPFYLNIRGSFDHYMNSGYLPILILSKQKDWHYFSSYGTIYINGKTYRSYMHNGDSWGEGKSYYKSDFPPGTYIVTTSGVYAPNGLTYNVEETFVVPTTDSSISLEQNQSNVLVTYMYNNTTPIPNAPIQILKGNNVIDTLTTNSNGQCDINGQIDNIYTAKAIDIDDSTLLTSNTIDFYPALYSDKNFVRQGEDITLTCYTGRENDDTNIMQKSKYLFTDDGINGEPILTPRSSTITVTRENNGTLLHNTGASNTAYVDIPSNCVIEFDAVTVGTLNYILFCSRNFGNDLPFNLSSNANSGDTIKAVLKDNVATFFVNGNQIGTPRTISNVSEFRFGMQINTNGTDMKYKNLRLYSDEKIYPIGETIFVDKGVTGDKNTHWNDTNVSISVESDGTLVSNSTGSRGSYCAYHPNTTTTSRYDYSFSSPLAIEFDIVSASDYTIPSFQIVDPNNHVALNKTLSALGCKSANTHMKIVVTNAEILVSVNNGGFVSYSHSMDTNFRINFGLSSGYNFKYKNFKIYETVEFSTTNENGLTTFTYKGTGAGETNFYGKTNDFESNILTIDDYIPDPTTITLTGDKSIAQNGDSITLTASATDKYDLAVSSGYSVDFIQKNKHFFTDSGVSGTANSDWKVVAGTGTKSVTNDGTTLSNTNTARYDIFTRDANIYWLNAPFKIELDCIAHTGNARLQVYSATTTDALNAVSSTGHWIIEYDGTTITTQKDNLTPYSYTRDLKDARIGFYVPQNHSITYKNLEVIGDVKVYPIIDTLFSDTGVTGDTNPNWYNNTYGTVSVGSDGTLLTSSDTTNFLMHNASNSSHTSSDQYIWNAPFVVEFDVVSLNGSTSEVQFQVYSNETTSNWATELDGIGHYKAVVLNGKQRLYKNGLLMGNVQSYSLPNCRITLRVKNSATLKYKNFKVYEIAENSITDANGIATCRLIGDGSGLETYSAKCENIESEPIEVIDGVFADIGTSGEGYKKFYNYSNFNPQVQGDGTLLTNTVASTYNYYANLDGTSDLYDFTAPYCIEFDAVDFGAIDSTKTAYIGTQIAETGQSGAIRNFNQLNITEPCHLKITVDGSQIIYQVDDRTPITQNYSTTQTRVSFILNNGYLKYRNFVIYPIESEEPTPVEPVPTTLTLSNTKDILSAYDSESTTLTATVLDENDNAMEGESVVFKKGSSTLDTVQTNSSGVATYTYTADGSGDVTITVECSNLQETYSIEDCLYFNSSEVSRTTTNGSTIYDSNMSITLPSKCEISFDFWSNNSNTTGEHRFFLLPKSQFYTNTTQPQYGLFADQKSGNIGNLGKRENNSTVTSYANFLVTGSTWHTVKWVKNSTSVDFYMDTTLKGNQTISWLDNYSDWCFSMTRWSSGGTSTMKNVKIKPL